MPLLIRVRGRMWMESWPGSYSPMSEKYWATCLQVVVQLSSLLCGAMVVEMSQPVDEGALGGEQSLHVPVPPRGALVGDDLQLLLPLAKWWCSCPCAWRRAKPSRTCPT